MIDRRYLSPMKSNFGPSDSSYHLAMRQPAIIFDLDGTLVDSVYQHVTAWHGALRNHRILLAQWRIHRAIGMSGSLFLPKLLRDEGCSYSKKLVVRLEAAHAKQFHKLSRSVEPLPGSKELLRSLRRRSIPFAVATSGDAQQTMSLLHRVTDKIDFPVVTADDVQAAKPAPDLFDVAAQKLEIAPNECFIVGDSVWDVLAGRRMNASVVAVRSGGFDGHELQEAGAYRVYADALELSQSLEQLGIASS
jgi:HAD superfamily hydrolase (TIGR01509 family)